MLIAPEGRFIPVNMDRCQDLMGGLFEHVTPGSPGDEGVQNESCGASLATHESRI